MMNNPLVTTGLLLFTTVIRTVIGAALPCTTQHGTPQYYSKLDRRCSPCNVRVCRGLKPLPAECLCFCLNKWPDEDYSLISEEKRRACREPLPPVNGQNSPDSSTLSPTDIGQFVWLVILSIIVLCLVVDRTKDKIHGFCGRKSSRTGRGERQAADEEVPLTVIGLVDVQVTDTPDDQHTGREPIQASADSSAEHETFAKTPRVSEAGFGREADPPLGRVPQQTHEPAHRGEGAPGGKYSLLPHGNTSV